MSSIQCPATVSTDASGAPLCLDGSLAPVAWIVVPEFDVSTLDSSQLAEAWAAGFILVGTAWAIGYGVKTILRMLGR